MAADVKVESCRMCLETLPKKSRRVIFSEFFTVRDQLAEVIGRIPHPNDGESSYVCSGYFNKLNRLSKLDFDISHKLAELRHKKVCLVEELREKYLLNRPPKSPFTTPRKMAKRVISHSPTPRKVKERPPEKSEEEDLSVKPRKRLIMPRASGMEPVKEEGSAQLTPKLKKKMPHTSVLKPFSPGKVKVVYRNVGKEVQSKVVRETDMKEIIKGLARGNSLKLIGKKLLKSKLSEPIQRAVIDKLEQECKQLSKQSLLIKCSSADLHNFSIQQVNVEGMLHVPYLYNILDTLTRRNHVLNAVISSLLLRCRNIQLSRLHHIVAQILDHGGATDEFIYQRLYKSSSAADPGTLYQLRNIIGRVDVKGPDEVVSSYRSHYSFIEDCLDGYIVGACMHLLGMETIDSEPQHQPFLCNEDKHDYIKRVSRNILDKYVKVSEEKNVKEMIEMGFLIPHISRVQECTAEVDELKHRMEEMYDSTNNTYTCYCGKKYKTDGWFRKHLVAEHEWNFTAVTESEKSKLDHIALYRSSFMKCALLLRDTNDAFKYGDGDRILRNLKCVLTLENIFSFCHKIFCAIWLTIMSISTSFHIVICNKL